MMEQVLTENPNAVDEFPFVAKEDLEKVIKNYGKP